MKKKCIIIIAVVCVAVVAVAGTVFGVRAYNDYTLQQQTGERIKSIDDTYADFLDETDRSKKLEKLSDFIKNKPSTNDEIAVEVLNAVEPKYSETLEKMQKYFTDDYDKIIKDNTIISDSLNKMNDKKKIQSCIDKLNSLEEIIDSEKEIVFNQNSQNNADSYLKKTDGLISSYSDRIQEIEKAEEQKAEEQKAEEDKKAAEEKKKQEESENSSYNDVSSVNDISNEDNSYSESNDYNVGTSNNSSDNSYSDGNSTSNNNGGNGTMVGGRYVEGSWHSYTDEDGTSYFDDKGNAWDDKGNTWNYYEIWDEIGIEHWTYAVE